MVLEQPSYAANARSLAEKLNAMDGAKMAAEVIWKFILKEKSFEKEAKN